MAGRRSPGGIWRGAHGRGARQAWAWEALSSGTGGGGGGQGFLGDGVGLSGSLGAGGRCRRRHYSCVDPVRR